MALSGIESTRERRRRGAREPISTGLPRPPLHYKLHTEYAALHIDRGRALGLLVEKTFAALAEGRQRHKVIATYERSRADVLSRFRVLEASIFARAAREAGA